MGLAAFLQQHLDDLPRQAVTEQLPARLLVPGNAVALDQRNEVALRVTAQRRTAKTVDCPTGNSRGWCTDW